MVCPLCGSEFEPEPGQKECGWALSWCSFEKGLVCPACRPAAKEMGAEACVIVEYGETRVLGGIAPWKSDILARLGHVAPENAAQQRQSESWRAWYGRQEKDRR